MSKSPSRCNWKVNALNRRSVSKSNTQDKIHGLGGHDAVMEITIGEKLKKLMIKV